MPDELAYDITRVLFEKKSELAAIHPEAAQLSLERGAAGIAGAVSSGGADVLRRAETHATVTCQKPNRTAPDS